VNLQHLDLSHNRVGTIQNLERLRNLRSVNLAHNRIVRLGDGLQSLQRLQVLDLSDNRIAYLNASEVDRLGELRTLSLAHNRLREVCALLSAPLLWSSLIPAYLHTHFVECACRSSYVHKCVYAYVWFVHNCVRMVCVCVCVCVCV
jgi:Leucine rich repeat/Leucine Rich repeat